MLIIKSCRTNYNYVFLYKISSLINTCCNIEGLLVDVSKHLKNIDVDSADTIQKINKLEEIIKDKYFMLNLAN